MCKFILPAQEIVFAGCRYNGIYYYAGKKLYSEWKTKFKDDDGEVSFELRVKNYELRIRSYER